MMYTVNIHVRPGDEPRMRPFFEARDDSIGPWVSIDLSRNEATVLCSDPDYLDTLADTCREAAVALREEQGKRAAA
jgi:hypothetical protein